MNFTKLIFFNLNISIHYISWVSFKINISINFVNLISFSVNICAVPFPIEIEDRLSIIYCLFQTRKNYLLVKCWGFVVCRSDRDNCHSDAKYHWRTDTARTTLSLSQKILKLYFATHFVELTKSLCRTLLIHMRLLISIAELGML